MRPNPEALHPGAEIIAIQHRVELHFERVSSCWRDAHEPSVGTRETDAAVTGCAPGTVIRCEGDSLPTDEACRFTSTHSFGVLDAIEMAKHLGSLPQRVIIYGIEAARTGAGDTMCEEVSRAIDEVVAEVREEVNGQFPV